jgi:hypothetical protein
MSDRSLIFLYRRSRMGWGSTVMRAQQLAQLVAPHLPDIDVRVKAFSRREVLQNIFARFAPAGAAIFVTKGAVKVLHPSTVDILHRRGCRVCLDVVDTRRDLLPGPDIKADCLISPSLNGIEILKSHVEAAYPASGHVPLVMPVLHNADIRLYGQSLVPQHRARPVYWGAMANAVTSAEIAAQVDFLDGSDSGSFSATLNRILHYNVHYAVRPDSVDLRIKPFTKGVNAAVLGAIVLVDRMVPDAKEFLGEDYPFLIDRPEESCVLEGLARLRDAFAGPDWALAQSRCAEMANRVSPEALARQIRQMISATGG